MSLNYYSPLAVVKLYPFRNVEESQRQHDFADTSTTLHSSYSSHQPFSGPNSAGWQSARVSSVGYYHGQAQVRTSQHCVGVVYQYISPLHRVGSLQPITRGVIAII